VAERLFAVTENLPPNTTIQLIIVDIGWDSLQNAFALHITLVL
jgi:hypothetical protein